LCQLHAGLGAQDVDDGYNGDSMEEDDEDDDETILVEAAKTRYIYKIASPSPSPSEAIIPQFMQAAYKSQGTTALLVEYISVFGITPSGFYPSKAQGVWCELDVSRMTLNFEFPHDTATLTLSSLWDNFKHPDSRTRKTIRKHLKNIYSPSYPAMIAYTAQLQKMRMKAKGSMRPKFSFSVPLSK
jgi:hypothetical protein